VAAFARRRRRRCGVTLTCEAGQTGCAAASTHPTCPLVSADSHVSAAPLAQGYGNATLDNHMENENDAQISALLGKVNQLKQVSVQIGDHVREDNKLLNGMGDQFDTSGSMLGGTVKRLTALANSKDGWHMVYLAMFVVLVFLFIYKMTR
jgi:blocked-early-in-transport protein 1